MRHEKIKNLKDTEFRRLTGIKKKTFKLMISILEKAEIKKNVSIWACKIYQKRSRKIQEIIEAQENCLIKNSCQKLIPTPSQTFTMSTTWMRRLAGYEISTVLFPLLFPFYPFAPSRSRTRNQQKRIHYSWYLWSPAKSPSRFSRNWSSWKSEL